MYQRFSAYQLFPLSSSLFPNQTASLFATLPSPQPLLHIGNSIFYLYFTAMSSSMFQLYLTTQLTANIIQQCVTSVLLVAASLVIHKFLALLQSTSPRNRLTTLTMFETGSFSFIAALTSVKQLLSGILTKALLCSLNQCLHLYFKSMSSSTCIVFHL